MLETRRLYEPPPAPAGRPRHSPPKVGRAAVAERERQAALAESRKTRKLLQSWRSDLAGEALAEPDPEFLEVLALSAHAASFSADLEQQSLDDMTYATAASRRSATSTAIETYDSSVALGHVNRTPALRFSKSLTAFRRSTASVAPSQHHVRQAPVAQRRSLTALARRATLALPACRRAESVPCGGRGQGRGPAAGCYVDIPRTGRGDAVQRVDIPRTGRGDAAKRKRGFANATTPALPTLQTR